MTRMYHLNIVLVQTSRIPVEFFQCNYQQQKLLNATSLYVSGYSIGRYINFICSEMRFSITLYTLVLYGVSLQVLKPPLRAGFFILCFWSNKNNCDNWGLMSSRWGTAGMRCCFQVGALAIVSTICHLDKVRPLKYTIVSYRLTEALKYTIQQFKWRWL